MALLRQNDNMRIFHSTIIQLEVAYEIATLCCAAGDPSRSRQRSSVCYLDEYRVINF